MFKKRFFESIYCIENSLIPQAFMFFRYKQIYCANNKFKIEM